jgi:hypothetical protein
MFNKLSETAAENCSNINFVRSCGDMQIYTKIYSWISLDIPEICF